MGEWTKKTFALYAVLILIVLPLLTTAALWTWVLTSQPLDNPLAATVPWPVACSTKGCVTTTGWVKQYEAELSFAQTTETEPPTPIEALTTVVRHHLVKHAVLRSPVTLADVVRYRQEILNLTDEQRLQEAVNMSLTDYDNSVLLPYLQQEALRQQLSVESVEELYAQLSSERSIVVLPFSLRWNKERGEVTVRD